MPSPLRAPHQYGVLDTVGMTEVSAITSSLRAPKVRSNPGKLLDCSTKLALVRNDEVIEKTSENKPFLQFIVLGPEQPYTLKYSKTNILYDNTL